MEVTQCGCSKSSRACSHRVPDRPGANEESPAPGANPRVHRFHVSLFGGV